MTVNHEMEVHFSKFDKRVIAWFAGVGGTLVTAAIITGISVLVSLHSNMKVQEARLSANERQTATMHAAMLEDGKTVARMQSTLEALNETLRELRTELRTPRNH